MALISGKENLFSNWGHRLRYGNLTKLVYRKKRDNHLYCEACINLHLEALDSSIDEGKWEGGYDQTGD